MRAVLVRLGIESGRVSWLLINAMLSAADRLGRVWLATVFTADQPKDAYVYARQFRSWRRSC